MSFPVNNSLKLPFWIRRKAAQAFWCGFLATALVLFSSGMQSKRWVWYHVFICNGSEPKNVPNVFSDVDSVIDLCCSFIQSKFNCFEAKHEVAFLRCLCERSNIERKQIIRKHKSTSEIAATGRKRREIYSSMDPEKKIIRTSFKLFGKVQVYGPIQKNQNLSNKDEKFRSMNSHDKEQLLSNWQQKYKEPAP